MFASLAPLAHELSTRSQRYIISLKTKVEYSISSNLEGILWQSLNVNY